MSEPAGTETGATGEVDTSATGTSGEAGATGSAAEDQAAEEALHGIMESEDPDELKKQLARMTRLAQRHERTARDNSNAATKLRELENASKTELQKAVEAQQSAERERDAARVQNARMIAANAHGLGSEFADYLGEGTEEEIDARAEALNGVIAKAAQKLAEEMITQQQGNGFSRASGGTRSRPVESMRPGAQPAGNRAPGTNNDLFRQLMSGPQ